jgi:hypothetical protein
MLLPALFEVDMRSSLFPFLKKEKVGRPIFGNRISGRFSTRTFDPKGTQGGLFSSLWHAVFFLDDNRSGNPPVLHRTPFGGD